MKVYVDYILFQSGDGLRPFLNVTHMLMDDKMNVVHYETHSEVAGKGYTCKELVKKWQDFLKEGAKIEYHGTTEFGIKWLKAERAWRA